MTFNPERPLPYRNTHERKVAYVALCVGQHPYRFDISKKELERESVSQVNFEVAILYHLEQRRR
jgi:hypothetical protein